MKLKSIKHRLFDLAENTDRIIAEVVEGECYDDDFDIGCDCDFDEVETVESIDYRDIFDGWFVVFICHVLLGVVIGFAIVMLFLL